ncbi:phosphotransferase family protein [Embleya sp. NBC_00896]|uniref:phosphotransferase family protein n=1 Tax=Embleya sp. NBC_00896 TaxID=2975961 RepID=UPI0038655EEA|nr:phosphotransferase [Embleya sp. NBC_00896]
MRRQWAELPRDARDAIERQIGLVRSVATPDLGVSSEFTAILTTDCERVFCKGIRADGQRAWMHRNEAAVSPHVPAEWSPPLLWELVVAGWLLLGFEYVPGSHPDLSPNSADLGPVAETVAALADVLTPCPAAARYQLGDRWGGALGWAALYGNAPDDLDPWARRQIATLATWERTAWLSGDTLAHVDLNPGNMLVTDGRVRVVDWAWSARGPAWVDAAYLVVRLVHKGHAPESAEAWARQVPAFAKAPEPVLTAFAAKLAGMWEFTARSPKARPHARALADAARVWVAHRLQ